MSSPPRITNSAKTVNRKSRALVGLGRLEEARDAVVDGLQFEPTDKASATSQAGRIRDEIAPLTDVQELNTFLKEIDEKLEAEEA